MNFQNNKYKLEIADSDSIKYILEKRMLNFQKYINIFIKLQIKMNILWNKNLIKRILLYILGMNIMAIGIVLNTRTDLGVAAISSVPFAYSILLNMSLGLTTFILYIIFILVQCSLLKKLDITLFLQIPMAILVSIFIEIYDNYGLGGFIF